MSTFRGYFDSGRTVSAAIEAANRWQSIFQIAYSVIVIGLLDTSSDRFWSVMTPNAKLRMLIPLIGAMNMSVTTVSEIA